MLDHNQGYKLQSCRVAILIMIQGLICFSVYYTSIALIKSFHNAQRSANCCGTPSMTVSLV